MVKAVSTEKAILVLFGGMFLLAGLVSQVSILRIFLLIVIQFLVFIGPGMAIQTLLGIRHIDRLSLFFSSYIVGYSIAVLAYLVLLLCGYPKLILAYAVLMLISCFFLRNKLIDEISAIGKSDRSLVRKVAIIFVCAFLVGFIFYQLPNLSALQVGYWSSQTDSFYYMKCCLGATKEFPLPDYSYSSTQIYWHVFSCLGLALQKILSGIEMADIVFRLSYIMHVFMLLSSLYTLARLIIKNNTYIVYILVGSLFCSGVEGLTHVYYLEHLYACTLGCAMGLSLLLLGVFFTLKCTQESFRTSYFSLAILILIVCTGVKMPYGALLSLAMGLIIIIKVWKSHQNKKITMLFLSAVVCIFIGTTALFIVKPHEYASVLENQQLTISIRTAFSNPLGRGLVKLMEPVIGLLASYIVSFVLFLVNIHIVSSILFLFALNMLFRYRRLLDTITITFLLCTIVGLMLFCFLSHPGYSQVYFVFAVIPFPLFLFFYIVERCEDRLIGMKLMMKRCILALLLIGILFPFGKAQSTFFVSNYPFWSTNISNMTASTLTKYEEEGLLWARHHLPEEAIFVTNKIYAENGGRSCVSSVLSERTAYVEGYVYLYVPSLNELYKRMEWTKDYYYSPSEENRVRLLCDGVEYSIHYKQISAFQSLMGSVIYENQDIAIIKLYQ